jgi:ergothioneine biosynthesis protein EgtB
MQSERTPDPQVSEAKREPIAASNRNDPLSRLYCEVRAQTERLCAPLTPEDAVVQSMPDASPAKWHLAHTTWFFETFVLEPGAVRAAPDPSYRYLFNSYYNDVGRMHPRRERGLLTRPSLAEVMEYRRRVDAAMDALLARDAIDASTADVIVLGVHHEQQHQELILTDVKHAFSCNPSLPAYQDRTPPRAESAPPQRWCAFDEGVREIGFDGAGFSFDNERPRHRAFVRAFELASRPVTAGEYAEFVADGGYSEARLWLSDGWTWVQNNRLTAPLYWQAVDGDFMEFTLAGARPLDRGAPVCHLSFYEAYAYARWAGARLPTEHEWETAADGAAIEGNFADAGLYHPMAPANGAARKLEQMFGDVWEWTASAYLPYPGFREPEGALGEYNGKFMSGQMVLRGGSCATPRSHIRATYRNFFHPDARWQFAGLRLARDL